MKLPALKFLLLRLLEKSPKTGYELMKEVKSFFGTSTPGSVYPLLRWWEERGYIKKEEGKYALTEKGYSFLREMEEKRRQYIEIAKKELIALAKALRDPDLEKLVSYIPLREKIGEDGIAMLASFVEILINCKDKKREEIARLLEGC